MPTITKGAFKALLQSQGKPPKVLPRQQHPDQIAIQYTKAIQAIMRWVQERVKAELYPKLQALTAEASRIATTDADDPRVLLKQRVPFSGKFFEVVRIDPEEALFRYGVRTEWVVNTISKTEAGAQKAASFTNFHSRKAREQGIVSARVVSAEQAAADPTIFNPRAPRAPEGGVPPAAAEGATAAEGKGLDAIGATLDKLRAEVAEKFTREELAGIVEPFAGLTEKFQAEQLNRQLREAVAVDVVGSEPWIGKAVDEFTRENVALIRTIPSRYFDEIETTIRREAADGVRWEELVTGIEERYDVSRSRSKIIARDQLGKFFGDLNRVRQTDLGITRFIWRSMRDNRVRPEHADIDGQSFEWGSAPDGGPGEAVLCRCYAEPDLSSVLDEAA